MRISGLAFVAIVAAACGGAPRVRALTGASAAYAGSSAVPRPGHFVAITGRQQPDGSRLASIVKVSPASMGATIPAGQRPLTEGNLMTNAPIAAIDQISG